ncbi:coiled-coil domain-containing protein [Stachybotrys elegans]|uniref:Coiled-coil domain-containing protein n=1 Tax=Stachybotrys elegans TaxID=80388 RepID=A0A8K0SGC8_9HYPO|nr:coiled-coil domain-containing protein [Stachybotrys elegans]
MDPAHDRPVPREPRSVEVVARIQVKNRRRQYLEQHPSYFDDPEHELADPIQYQSLVKTFQSPQERQEDQKRKGYGLLLEADLNRGEARISEVQQSQDGRNGAENGKPTADDPWKSSAANKEQGQELWREFLTQRFVDGKDDDFDYALVDGNEDYDQVERQEAQDAWFEDEKPEWEADGRERQGETGVQDF